MPLSGGTSGAHDDAMHQGNAKRDVVGGVGGLDASGFLLAKGAGIAFPRTGSDDVHIYERTSGEEAYAFHRAGADDYTFYIKESNVWKRFQTESMKDVVNGIAALDAGGHVLAPGYRFTAARGAAEQITIRERTSGERVFRWIRNGANDYEARVNVGGVEKVVQHVGFKDVANGIAGLDAAARLLPVIGGVPSGVYFPYGGAVAPPGYLLCDGSAISRTTYSALFTAIGVAYGVGDGSTTFNIPGMQGKLPVGIGGSGVVNIGDVGGEQTHALIEAELAAHVHTIPIRTHTAINGDFVEGSTGSVEGSTPPTSSTGSGTAHENMPPYVGSEYIIKT